MKDLGIPKMKFEKENNIRFKLWDSPSLHSNHDEKPLEDEIMFQRLELLFEDLKKVKAEIDKHSLDSLCVDLSENNGTKKKFEDIKEEYMRVLFDVEGGQKEVKKLKNSIDSLENKSKNHKNKFTYVYHLRCKNTSNRGIYGRVNLKPKRRSDITVEPNIGQTPVCNSPRKDSDFSKCASKDLFSQNKYIDSAEKNNKNEKQIRSRGSDDKLHKKRQSCDDFNIKTRPCLKKSHDKKDPLNERSKYFKINKSENYEKQKEEKECPDLNYVVLKRNKSKGIENIEKQNLMILNVNEIDKESPHGESEEDEILNSTNNYRSKGNQVTGKNSNNFSKNDPRYKSHQSGKEKSEKSPNLALKDRKDKEKTRNKKKVGSKSPDIVLLKDPRNKKRISDGNKVEEFIDQNKLKKNITIGDIKNSEYRHINEGDKILNCVNKFLSKERLTARNISYEKSVVKIPSPAKTDSTITRNINLSLENQELSDQISQLREDLFKFYNNYRTDVDVEKSSITNDSLSKDSYVFSKAGSQTSNSSLKKRKSDEDTGKIDKVDKNHVNNKNIDKTKSKNTLDELNNELSIKEKLIIKLDEASKVLENACDQETNRLKNLKNQEVDISHKLLRKSYEFDELLAENIKTKRILDDKHDDIRMLEDGNKKLSKEKGALTYDKQKLMKQTGELANKIKSLNDQSQKWLMSENRLKNLIEREKKSHEVTKKDLDDAKRKLLEQIKEIDDFNTDKELAVIKAAQLETSIRDMRKKLDDKEKYLRHLESRTKGFEQELKSTNEAYKNMINDQIAQLRSTESKAEENIQHNIEMEKLLKLFNDLKLTNSFLKEESIKVGQENLNVQYERLNLTKKHEDLENQVKKYKTQLEKIRLNRKAKKLQIRELDVQIKSIASIKTTKDSKIKDLEQTIMQSNQILQNLEKKFNFAEQENTNITKTMENTNQEISCLKKNNLELKAKLNQISNIDVIPSSLSCGNLKIVPIYQNPIRLTKSEHVVKTYNDGCDQCNDVSWKSDFLGQFQTKSVRFTPQNELINDSNAFQLNNCERLQNRNAIYLIMPKGKCVDEEFKELKSKLAKTVAHFNELQKKNHSLPNPSKAKDLELLTGQVVLQQTRLLFEDLRKIKVEIEDNFFNTVHGDIGGVNSARHRLEKAKDEYLKLLYDVEEGRKSIAFLRNNLETVREEDLNDVFCDDNLPCGDGNKVTWIKEKDSQEDVCEFQDPDENTTYVYQCNTAVSPQEKVSRSTPVKTSTNSVPKSSVETITEDENPYFSYVFRIESENNALKEHINKLQSELGNVTSNFGELHSSLGYASTENKTRQMELEKLNEDVKYLRDRICVADQTVKRLSEENAKFRKASKFRNDSEDLMGESLMSIFEPQHQISLELAAALKKNEKYESELKEAVEIVRKLTRQLEYKDREIDNLNTAKYSLEKICSKETELLKNSKSQEIDMAQKLLEKSYQIESLLSENGELKRKVEALSGNIENIEKKKDALLQEKDELMNQVETLIEENTELSNIHDITKSEAANTKNTLRRIENSLKSEQRCHSSTRAELMKLQKEYTTLQRKFKAHRLEKDAARDKAAKLLVEVEGIANKLKQYEARKCSSENEVKTLQKEMAEMKRTYDKNIHESNLKLKHSENKCMLLEEQMKEPVREVEGLRKQIADMKRINSSLAEECVKSGQDHFKLKYEKVDLLKKEERLESTIKNLRLEVDELKNIKMQQSLEIRELDTKISLLREEKINSETKIKSCDRRISTLTEQNKQLTLETQELERSKAELKRELDGTKRNLRGVMSENFNIRLKMRENISRSELSEFSTDTSTLSRPETVVPKSKITILNDFHGQFDPSECKKALKPVRKCPTAVNEKKKIKRGILRWPKISSAPAKMGGHMNYSVYNVEFDIHSADMNPQPVTHIVSNLENASEEDFQSVYMNPIHETKSINKLN